MGIILSTLPGPEILLIVPPSYPSVSIFILHRPVTLLLQPVVLVMFLLSSQSFPSNLFRNCFIHSVSQILPRVFVLKRK